MRDLATIAAFIVAAIAAVDTALQHAFGIYEKAMRFTGAFLKKLHPAWNTIVDN
jgi:hypothetical protein